MNLDGLGLLDQWEILVQVNLHRSRAFNFMWEVVLRKLQERFKKSTNFGQSGICPPYKAV